MPEPKLIFLAYINRSGSTLLSHHLSKHPSICVCPEAEILVNLLLYDPSKIIDKKLLGKLNGSILYDPKLQNWKLSPIVYESVEGVSCLELFIIVLKKYRSLIASKAHYILFKEQNLMRFMMKFGKTYSDLIYNIVLIRDPRAILYSQRNSLSPENGMAFSNNSFTTLFYCRRFMQKVKRLRGVNLIRFEDFVMKPMDVSADLFSSFGLQTEMSEKGVYYSLPDSHKILHSKVVNKVDAGVVKKWERRLSLYDEWLAAVFFRTSVYYPIPRRPFSPYLLFKLINDVFRFTNYLLSAKYRWIRDF